MQAGGSRRTAARRGCFRVMCGGDLRPGLMSDAGRPISSPPHSPTAARRPPPPPDAHLRRRPKQPVRPEYPSIPRASMCNTFCVIRLSEAYPVYATVSTYHSQHRNCFGCRWIRYTSKVKTVNVKHSHSTNKHTSYHCESMLCQVGLTTDSPVSRLELRLTKIGLARRSRIVAGLQLRQQHVYMTGLKE